MPVTLTRRTALIAAAAVPLAACSADGRTVEPGPADPDRPAREAALRAEHALLGLYRATAEAHPELATSLAPFIARHERHAEEITGLGPGGEPATPDVAPEAPASSSAAVTALREAEAEHAAARIEDGVAAYDYELARVFASIAACETAHEHLLGGIV